MDYHESGKAGDCIIYGTLSVKATIVALGMAVLLIGGCSTNRVDLVDKGSAQREDENSMYRYLSGWRRYCCILCDS